MCSDAENMKKHKILPISSPVLKVIFNTKSYLAFLSLVFYYLP
uniref:Uncharacterized protein n=1 Tax=Anguilla anguilla TaxID=7936 RepID=A0A0E9UJ84_ANGAN